MDVDTKASTQWRMIHRMFNVSMATQIGSSKLQDLAPKLSFKI